MVVHNNSFAWPCCIDFLFSSVVFLILLLLFITRALLTTVSDVCFDCLFTTSSSFSMNQINM